MTYGLLDEQILKKLPAISQNWLFIILVLSEVFSEIMLLQVK